MNFSSHDYELLSKIRRMLRRETLNTRTARYAEEVKLLWTNKDYVLVKTGPWSGCSSVYLYSRQRLLCLIGNPYKNAMVEIALASIDPLHNTWQKNYRRKLWEQSDHVLAYPQFSKRRWSKTLLKEMIAYAEKLSADLPQAMEAERELRRAKRQHIRDTCNRVKDLGLEVMPVGETPDKDFVTKVDGWGNIRFTPLGGGQIKLYIGRSRVVSNQEFMIFMEAMSKIDSLRKKEALDANLACA